MTTYITHIRMSPPSANDHEHITHVQWRQQLNTGTTTRAAMVDFIDEGNSVYVGGTPDAAVGVVRADPPYLRTHADGQWNNNLLSLPHF